MPICKKCNISFSNRITINDKYIRLRKRKYCLECSPLGKHNTKPIHLYPEGYGEKDFDIICQDCGKKYKYNKKHGHGLKRCNSCVSNYQRYKRKIKCVKYKGGSCEKCGYNKCIQALDFHHINPEEKLFSISGNHCRKWEIVKKELDKCKILCRNCHSEEHYLGESQSG